MIAFDSETWRIEPGIAAPRGVIGSWYDGTTGGMDRFRPLPECEYPAKVYEKLFEILVSDEVISGANIAYDFGVALTTWPQLIDAVFAKYERGQVWEIFVGAALDAVFHGHLFKERSGAPMRSRDPLGVPFGKVRERYALDLLSWQWLNIPDAKENDEYKLLYRELEQIPIKLWPKKAREYPIDDARHTWHIAAKQMAVAENCGPIVRWKPGTSKLVPVVSHSQQTHQARAAFAMHLASVWGMRTNGPDVEKLAASIELRLADKIKALKYGGTVEVDTEAGTKEKLTVRGGLLHGPPDLTKPKSKRKEEGAENIPEIKRRIVRAYTPGEVTQCPTCEGTGKIKSPRSKQPVTCARYFQFADGTWSDHNEAEKTCDGTGLKISDTVPRSDGGGIKRDRDTCEESGDPDLELLAEIGPYETIRDRFIPWLLEGAQRPLNVRPNVIVETIRASYDGIIQTLPRKGGVRECVEARPGWVFCSVDYNALELSTLAQACLWIVGYSELANSINAGKDQHTQLAAEMTNSSYEDLLRRVKAEDPLAVDFRQAAKAGNFGFGGLMGAAKFALTQRKQNGLRMCRLMGREPAEGCGSKKIYEWKRRPCPPLCEACVLASEDLRKAWKDTWHEVNDYFKFSCDLPGMHDEAREDDEQPRGRIISPGSGYIRSNITASSAANHSFQHLAAMGAKHALWNVTKECFTDRNSPLYGSHVVLFLHDELIVEMREEVAHEAAYRMADVMVSSMREFVPDVRVSAEPALMRRWYKGAKTVKDSNGRLTVWEPTKKAA